MPIDPLDILKTMDHTGGKPAGYTLSAGAVLGQYRILRPLGRGGMGEVYEVEHGTLERRYALKLLPPDFAAQPGALERFRREAKVMANLDHPNILKVDDFGEAEGRYWLRMELVEGIRRSESGGRKAEESDRIVSLQDLADANGGRIEQRMLAGILRQILDGLAYAHGRGAVHRDLKPSNILLAKLEIGNSKLGEPASSPVSSFKFPVSSATILISDFGLVRLVGEEWVRGQAQVSVQRSLSLGALKTLPGTDAISAGSSTRSMLGTYEYMSPEQKRGEDATPQSDLYAVGLMAFKLLTGQNLCRRSGTRRRRGGDRRQTTRGHPAVEETTALSLFGTECGSARQTDRPERAEGRRHEGEVSLAGRGRGRRVHRRGRGMFRRSRRYANGYRGSPRGRSGSPGPH